MAALIHSAVGETTCLAAERRASGTILTSFNFFFALSDFFPSSLIRLFLSLYVVEFPKPLTSGFSSNH